MATKNTNSDTETTRTEPIDVTDPEQSLALLAAWQGVFNFFKGRVNRWVQTDNGNVIAEGFTVESPFDPETILADISGRERRIHFPTALGYFQGVDPEPYTDANEMTNFMVNFTKGQGEAGSSKTPEYVRTAVAAYKNEIGLANRRGRKRSILRLDNISELSDDALVGTDPAAIDRLIAIATAAKNRATPPAAATTVEANA